MNRCDLCKTRECDYIEVNNFIKFLNRDKEKDEIFNIVDCPDKSKKQYTCDLVLQNKRHKKIYIEIKEVKYGFNRELKIPEDKGQLCYASLVAECIDELQEDKRIVLNHYSVEIPQKQIYKDEKRKFKNALNKFLEENNFQEINRKRFSYKRKKEEVQIEFKPKTKEEEQWGCNVLYEYKQTESLPLKEVIQQMSDIISLKNAIVKNCKNTLPPKQKFPHVDERKILLNILRVPTGYDIFFEYNLAEKIDKLRKYELEFKSAADENYLLYYSNQGLMNKDSDGKELFVIPLVGIKNNT